jgi:hypothetical protein
VVAVAKDIPVVVAVADRCSLAKHLRQYSLHQLGHIRLQLVQAET